MRPTAIATMTAGRTHREAATLGASIERLACLGLPVFAADAGSIPAFTDRARQVSRLELWREGTTLVQQIKACFGRVLKNNHRVVLYTEPDKKEFFECGVKAFLEETGSCHAEAVCIAARNPESFATFPPGQQSAELAFNSLASDVLGITPDLLYGPLILDLESVANYLNQIPADLGWGWRTYAIARSVLAGKRVASVVGPFCCPVEQRTETSRDRIYRLTQLKQNVEGLRLALEHSQSDGSATPLKNR
jgi:hypothetical protein